MKYFAIFLIFSSYAYGMNRYEYLIYLPIIEELDVDLDKRFETIAVLEARARDHESVYLDGELTMLCAMYILTDQLMAAHSACNEAVSTDKTNIAFNNRGVLRGKMKNAAGALEDFNHVRVPPEKEQAYIDGILRGDVRLAAAHNYEVAKQYVKDHQVPNAKQELSDKLTGSEVEDPIQ